MTAGNVSTIIGVENHEYEYEPTAGSNTEACYDA